MFQKYVIKLFKPICQLIIVFVTTNILINTSQPLESQHGIQNQDYLEQFSTGVANKNNSRQQLGIHKHHLYGPPIKRRIIPYKERLGMIKEYERTYYKEKVNVLSLPKINEFDFKFVIKPTKSCTNDTFLVILVHSRADFFKTRKAIRETWGGVAYGKEWPNKKIIPQLPKIKLVFVIALFNQSIYHEKLVKENLQYNDIVQGNFQDSYINMTLKSILGLQYVREECPHVKYMMKSDDDMFLNIPDILRLLIQSRVVKHEYKSLSQGRKIVKNVLKKRDRERTISGAMNSKSIVERDGVWGVHAELYPFESFPKYASGAAYIITFDIIGDLYEAAQRMPLFHVDDAFLTGVLAKVIGEVDHEQVPGFAYWGSVLTTPCAIVKNQMYTSTQVTDELKYKLWESISNSPLQC